MAREIEAVIDKELSRFDVPNKCVKRVAGGRHMRIVVEGPKKNGYLPYSRDCSGRGLFNFRADLRRLLRAVGFEKEVPQERVGSLGDALLEAASRSVHSETTITLIDKDTLAPDAPAALMQASAPKPIVSLPEPTPPTTVATKEKTMPDIMTPGRSQLTQAEVAQVTMLISQHAKVDFEKKVCDYHPSWSDERIWRMLATGDRKHLEVNTITKFRRSFFGQTPDEIKKAADGRATGNMSAVWRAIHDLQDRMTALEAAATEPERKSASSNGAYNTAHDH